MKKFDADKMAEEGSLEVTIGGHVFIAQEPTLKTMKELANRIPDPPKPEKDADGKVIPRPEKEQLEESVESLYPQLEVLLAAQESFEYEREVEDEDAKEGEKKTKKKKVKVAEGAPPPQDYVEKHLSMRRAGEMIQELMGEDANDPH